MIDDVMRAFSYIRWSSEHQSKGDSLRRQLALAEAYANNHSLVLDTSTYQDHGISAFTGANLVEGKLGTFLRAIDDGHIRAPCYLLVEALDRITRTEIDVALELFLSIIKRGVTIVTLQTEQVFSKETIKRDRGISLIIAISMLVQGHEDSAKRALRIRAAYDAKRNRGEKKITKIPSWLIPNSDRKTFKIDHTRAKLINRIFDMAIAGHGQRAIANVLLKERAPVMQWAKRWDQGAVGSVLCNHAVYGRKHRTNQDNFWPPIMGKDKFMTAQDAVRGRRWKGANRDGVPNIFAGLGFCAECGSRVRYIPSGNGHPYVKCLRAVDIKAKVVGIKDCRGRLFPYQACETAFIYSMSRRHGMDISGEYLVEKASQAPALRGEIAALKERQKSLLKIATLAEGVEAVAEELRTIQQQINTLQDQLDQLDRTPLSRKEIEQHRDLFDRYAKVTWAWLRDSDWMNDQDTSDAALTELRRQMKVAMARLFKKIEFGTMRPTDWRPFLFVTGVDGSFYRIDVSEFLSENSRKRQQHKAQAANRKPSGRKRR